MRLFIVGDVHGCLTQLKDLLEGVDEQIEEGDEVVFVGDYVDRGPDSKGVIDLLIERQKNHPNKHTFLMGNHEDMMLSGDYWLPNGGIQTIKSYIPNEEDWKDIPGHADFLRRFVPYEHKVFLNSLKMNYQVGKVVVVHAAIDPACPLEDQSSHTMLWERDFDGYNGEYNGGWTVVRGHTPLNGMKVTKNQFMIDTACVFGGELTCLVIDPDKPSNYHTISIWNF
ncbi:calcineurin-like phosphoesterase [Sinorhizobium phage phiN3]|uniref:Calcineurin-like phosphoesterase n=1 Tax=Sinorhizobium phage phiN3 TaxID=1647405 RepID=A0A0F6SJ14_9CAUD|nr:NinI-like serine-threonine phosphatase [Sinorhizobium phage phiN3]AKF13408.1 calcineurin-like phosphoesterase [Sinorhizobium phage phiN3]